EGTELVRNSAQEAETLPDVGRLERSSLDFPNDPVERFVAKPPHFEVAVLRRPPQGSLQHALLLFSFFAHRFNRRLSPPSVRRRRDFHRDGRGDELAGHTDRTPWWGQTALVFLPIMGRHGVPAWSTKPMARGELNLPRPGVRRADNHI